MMAYHQHLASHQSFWFHCMINLVEHVFDPRILHLIFDTKMVFSHGLWSGCYYWNMIAVDIVSTQTYTRYWLNNTPTKSCLQSIRSTFSAIHHLFWFQSFYTISTNMQSYWNICIINFSGVSISSSQTSNFSLMYALCNFIHLGFLEPTDFASLRLSIACFFLWNFPTECLHCHCSVCSQWFPHLQMYLKYRCPASHVYQKLRLNQGSISAQVSHTCWLHLT